LENGEMGRLLLLRPAGGYGGRRGRKGEGEKRRMGGMGDRETERQREGQWEKGTHPSVELS